MNKSVAVAALCLAGIASAQVDPQRNLERIVQERAEVFPPGTRIERVLLLDGGRAVIELSDEAVVAPLGDGQADTLVRELVAGLDFFTEITDVEVTVRGQPLWTYLPPSSEPPLPLARDFTPPQTPASAATLELQGKRIALHPSHGSYWDNATRRWLRAQRTLTGPNPRTNLPPGWTGSRYTPSDEYFWNRGLRWGSLYEDDITVDIIRYLRRYLESSGAEVFLSRELSDDAGQFDHNRFGYPNASFPLPRRQVAAKYFLEENGLPRWVWDEPSLVNQYDKDIRARPYAANFKGADLSLSLHTNAFGDGGARGTETYWYTSKYPYLHDDAVRFATAIHQNALKAIREWFDDSYGRAAFVNPYPRNGTPEWPYYPPYPTPFDYSGYTSWADRGVKTSNLGELREALMPAALIELAFHDDWKWYPDNLFLQDPIFQATATWGLYEGISKYFGVTPKPRLSATVVSSEVPALVGPNRSFTAAITLRNNGMTWNWGRRWRERQYEPYTVWQLRTLSGDATFAAPERTPIEAADAIHPGVSKTFTVPLLSPSASGVYPVSWRMTKADARGGDFGESFTAQVRVDADGPEISIASPSEGEHPFGQLAVEFSAADAWAGVSELTAALDGAAVSSGQVLTQLSPGVHALTVTARDGFDNSSTVTRPFTVVNTAGTVEGGGWAQLAQKKATFGLSVTVPWAGAQPQGELTFHDHELGLNVHATELHGFGISGRTATIAGQARIGMSPGHAFWLELEEGADGQGGFIRLELDTGYRLDAPLGGGNIAISAFGP